MPGRVSSEQLTGEPGARGGGSEPEGCVSDDAQCPWGDVRAQE